MEFQRRLITIWNDWRESYNPEAYDSGFAYLGRTPRRPPPESGWSRIDEWPGESDSRLGNRPTAAMDLVWSCVKWSGGNFTRCNSDRPKSDRRKRRCRRQESGPHHRAGRRVDRSPGPEVIVPTRARPPGRAMSSTLPGISRAAASASIERRHHSLARPGRRRRQARHRHVHVVPVRQVDCPYQTGRRTPHRKWVRRRQANLSSLPRYV